MDKKYTPEEAAKAVLKKAEEMLKSSSLAKSVEDRSKMSGKSGMVRTDTESNQNQKGVGQHGHKGSSGGISEAGAYHRDGQTGLKGGKDTAKAIHRNTLSDLKSMPKPNLTKTDDSTIAMQEKDQTPPDGVQAQGLPPDSPEKVNGNPPWGTEPGCHKLSKFMGRREERKKPKASAVSNEPLQKSTELDKCGDMSKGK